MSSDLHALPDPSDERAGLPAGARIFSLKHEAKEPGSEHAHLDAVPVADFADVGGNVGIALDAQWLLVDFDAAHPDIAKWVQRLDEGGQTWMQQARRGVHRLFSVPVGWTGTNTKITAKDSGGSIINIGDIKCNGYVVAPGGVVSRDRNGSALEPHRYVRLNACEPRPAPQWLLDICGQAKVREAAVESGQGRTRIELGNNDNELAKIAGFLRRRGFDAGAIATMLWSVIGSGIMEQDPTREPYTRSDAARIARSADKWEPGTALDLRIAPDEWISAATMPLTGAPIPWWLHGFIPRGLLTLLYGKGGCGKSSTMSWVAAKITQKGGLFVHVGVEETFQLFAARAALMGANRNLLMSIPSGGELRFPRDIPSLGRALETVSAGALYFDSIYTHFEREKAENAAERARRVLGALAALALKTGTTVLGTFHENKAGELLGSTEMENVARILLHASRGEAEGSPLRVHVQKTNLLDPGYWLEFAGQPVPWTDPETGEVQREYLDDGTLQPVMLTLPGAPVRRTKGEVQTADLERAREARGSKAEARAQQAKELWRAGWTQAQIATELGVSERWARKLVSEDDES